MIRVTDINIPELDVYARLTEAQLAAVPGPGKGLFIAESPKVIQRALEAGCRPVSILVEEDCCKGEALEIIEKCGDIPVYVGENAVLAKLTGYKLTRGLLCAMERPGVLTAEEVARIATAASRRTLKRDPVEMTEGYLAVIDEVERKVEENMDFHGRGSCHQRWSLTREYLEEYGIVWRSLGAMNPRFHFD